MSRTEEIKGYIHDRLEKNDIIKCIFQITVPKVPDNKYEEPTLKKIEKMIKRNNGTCEFVDTICGSFNLNRYWLETSKIECAVEYCGVYPVHWDINDIVELERMDYDGEIIINVLWVTDDGKYVPNH